jgi:hypothetical protein
MLDSEAKRKIESIETDTKSILLYVRRMSYCTSLIPLLIWFSLCILAFSSINNYMVGERNLKINKKLDQLIQQKETENVSERL